MELVKLSKILGGERVLHKRLKTQLDLIELSNRGIPKIALNHLMMYMNWSIGMTASLLPITERTIQRYSEEDCFNSVVSEQILQISQVIARGLEVFEDKEKFLSWMNHPNSAIANKTPFELMSSKFGSEMILDELGRIEHGIIS